MNKYKCFNSKCNNTTPRPDDRLFGRVEYICDKCSCSMDIICVDCNERVASDNTSIRTTEGQLCSRCWGKLTDGRK